MEKKDTVYRRDSMVWRYRWKEEALPFCVLTAFAFFINAAVQIRGLYMDDLYMWSCFADGSFLNYVFPVGSSRFRVLYNFVSYLEYFFVGNHIGWFVPVNLIVNGAIAYTIFRIAKWLSANGLIGFACGILYLLSRMSYYQIGQVYGMMESLALWAAITILYCLCRYLNGLENGENRYWIACGLYFANCFIHERYMALLPLFYLVLLMRREKNPVRWAVPAALFALVQVIRLLATGSVMPAGTGGTYVADTFDFQQTLVFLFQQIMHLFGINLGDDWLCPKTWEMTDRWVKLVVLGQILALFMVVILFIMKLIRSRSVRRPGIRNALLFIFFIGCCMVSSSVTIRLEMRWVYVSMAGALLFLAYMCGIISYRPKHVKENYQRDILRRYRGLAACLGLVGIYTFLSFLSETYYRSYYNNLYFWNSQKEYNSLADETWGKYGEAIFGKKIYILKNSYNMSRFYADTFFRTFDPERKAEGTEVIFVDSIRDFGQVTNNMLILREDPAACAYQDITGMVRELKCESIYGYYTDGWMDENAKIRVMAGSTGRIDLELLYPGVINGGEAMTIRMDGEETAQVEIDQNIQYVSLETVPYRTVELEFANNFYLEDAQEQRGEDRFSLIVNITAD